MATGIEIESPGQDRRAEVRTHRRSPSFRRADRQQRTNRRRISPLTLRILAVNVLALGILGLGLLYLGRYQDRLINAELDALRLEARIFASALAEGAVPTALETESALSGELARPMLRRLVETTRNARPAIQFGWHPDGR